MCNGKAFLNSVLVYLCVFTCQIPLLCQEIILQNLFHISVVSHCLTGHISECLLLCGNEGSEQLGR